ncbi:hypothetical protein LWF01_11425 [Saxibacter everestensis]|uniref:Transcriptional regulator n=1 Tax=Saxibacter everestensis TaxID=2909229 RepID=A0ABY8QR69_9MICO|nr:hypothetical protein LWF01_11425 [Brevibacteriaceae bacterium ZFBP1038]
MPGNEVVEEILLEQRRLRNRMISFSVAQLDQGEPSRRTLIRSTISQIADLAAAAERQPEREIPTLEDRALVDQLTVVIQDSVAHAGEDELKLLLTRLVDLRRAL